MLNVSRSAMVALVCLVIPSSACRKPPTAENKLAAGAQTPGIDAAKKPFPETLPDVLARVNGEPITRADFEQRITQMEAGAGRRVPKERRDEIYRKTLDDLINLKLLKSEVSARNFPADEKAAEEEMQKIRSQFPSDEEYRKGLAARGVTPEVLRANILDETRIKKMMATEAAGITPVTDAEVREFYDKNPDKFKQPEAVRASHILVRVQPGDEAANKKALAAIQSVHKQAKAGKDFGDLARKHSADGSAERGGDLGFFTKDQMVPEFANAAFALEPGQVSDVVQSSFGYHVIKVTERRPPSNVPFEQVTDKIRQYLTQTRQQEKVEAFVKVLRSKSKIEVLI